MKTKKGKILTSILIVFIIIVVAVFIVLNNIKNNANNVKIENINIKNLKDGLYEGECNLTPVKVKTKTTIKNGEIVNIDILEHEQALGKKAEKIIEEIKNKQTLSVDTVSGATVSSKCILKSIESSLNK